MTRRTALVPAAALAALLGLAACGDGGSTGAGQVAADAPYNAQDVSFVKDMQPHHEQAVEMAELVLEEDPSAEVAALATQIRTAQEREVEQLEALLEEFGVEEDGGGHGGGHGSGHGGGHAGGGMLSEDDLQALEDASGPEAERLFLEGMVAHHEGAIEMASAEVDGGEHPEAVALAKSIKADQEAELARMRQLLGQA